MEIIKNGNLLELSIMCKLLLSYEIHRSIAADWLGFWYNLN